MLTCVQRYQDTYVLPNHTSARTAVGCGYSCSRDSPLATVLFEGLITFQG